MAEADGTDAESYVDVIVNVNGFRRSEHEYEHDNDYENEDEHEDEKEEE